MDARGAHAGTRRVWLITGCSSGLGRELARSALRRGERVVATARNPEAVAGLADGLASEHLLACALDVTDPVSVQTAIDAAVQRFGAIDVVVNNAGISYFAGVEESEDAEVRRMFETNFFGLMRVTDAVLPLMRARRIGTVVNVASIAGLNGFASVGYYSATKFAVEGISEALAQEISPFGIRVLVVEPSGLSTEWARSASEASHPIAAYDGTPLRDQVLRARSSDVPQLGDPVRAADAIVDEVLSDGTAQHLPLGAGSFEITMAKLARLTAEYAALEDVARGVDR